VALGFRAPIEEGVEGGGYDVSSNSMTGTLGQRERVREAYWKRRDPILDDRMIWRAQTFRHMMHLLPGHSILEIGCGDGAFTRQLAKVTRGECPFTAITFDPDAGRPPGVLPELEFSACPSLERILEGRQFDFIVAHDMLDKRNAAWLLQQVFRRFGAKPDKKIVDRQAARPSSWKTPFIATSMAW
jgi:dolichol-phosphate mannosyltransferase